MYLCTILIKVYTYGLSAPKKRLGETFLLHTQNICMIGKTVSNHFGGLNTYMSTYYNSNICEFETVFLEHRISLSNIENLISPMLSYPGRQVT